MDALDHADQHAAFFTALEGHLVHEALHQEDSAAVGLEEILRGERIGKAVWIETAPLIADDDDDAGPAVVLARGAPDVDALPDVIAVPVLDGVDDRFPDRDAHPMHRILVKARHARDVIAHHLHEIEHAEGAVEIDADGVAAG